MPFIPHTQDDIDAMLASIGAKSIEELFDEIPQELKAGALSNIPPALTEMEAARLMQERAEADGRMLNFAGAGAYEHHIPAAVWEIAARGEFYTAYTPYQAEASQGTLQLLYEFQTMMASLTGLDVANASLYDGASALAEAVLMAVRAHKSSKRVLMPQTVHPVYRRVVGAVVKSQGIEIVELPYDEKTGRCDPALLSKEDGFAALVIPQPNFFGVLEEAAELADAAHQKGALAIALVNPVSLALLSPPGEWGADIAVGEGQPLGAPLSSGGPYFGFMCCRAALVRQMPGRIVGRTVDVDGKTGFCLTLQAREQHIRRSKATSNICTNQGLMVTAAAIHMAILGPQGLESAAAASCANTRTLVERLCSLPGVRRLHSAPFFHEAAIALPIPAREALAELGKRGIVGGYGLAEIGLADSLLVCATETKTLADIERYAAALAEILGKKAC